ncbi:hypothetical protein IWX78_001452 [Mycetocola sp. CAN_C7]|uniref:hypothetical protein n=1 Tax=Mycetocola sp. CAN_C7 TaxID=2787724 RepID=UPI0018CA1AD4
MTELLHLSALLPAAFGACCTVGGRRRGRVRSGFEASAAVVMLVAMADVAVGLGLVAPILWVVGLVVLAVVSPVIGIRHDRSREVRPHPGLHTSLGLIVMAGLIALMSAGHVASVPVHHGGGGLFLLLVFGGSAIYVGYSAWRAVTLYRMPRRDLLGCLEAASMAASVALMVGALAV